MNNHDLPSFYCPIDPAVHPNAGRIERRTVAWVDQVGLYRDDAARARGLATRSAELACRVLPDCPDDLAWLLGAWNHWSFALGDPPGAATGVPHFGMLLLRALEDPGYRPPGASPLGAALVELIDRTRRGTTAVQFQRLAEGLRDWLLAMAWHLTILDRNVPPTLDDFAAMRPSVTATRFFAAWIEIGRAIEVPAQARFAAPVRALTAAAGFVVACDNDLVGYLASPRRSSRGNIVDVLARHRHCSPREAVSETKSIRDRVMTRFLVLRDRICATASPELVSYLQGMNHYVRGFLDWMSATPRYAHEDRPVNLVIAGTPAGASTEPPAIPFMKWWWHL